MDSIYEECLTLLNENKAELYLKKLKYQSELIKKERLAVKYIKISLTKSQREIIKNYNTRKCSLKSSCCRITMVKKIEQYIYDNLIAKDKKDYSKKFKILDKVLKRTRPLEDESYAKFMRRLDSKIRYLIDNL